MYCDILKCKHYEDLKKDKDIHNNDLDLVKFFQEVINLRDEAQKE